MLMMMASKHRLGHFGIMTENLKEAEQRVCNLAGGLTALEKQWESHE